MTESGLAPRQETLEFTQPAVAAAASDISIVGEAPEDMRIIGASYIPDAAITGVNTNTRAIRIVNRGAAGAGTTLAASVQFNAGTNGVAGDELALALNGTDTDRNVAAGDVIAVESNAVGTGLADPGGRIQVVLARR